MKMLNKFYQRILSLSDGQIVLILFLLSFPVRLGFGVMEFLTTRGFDQFVDDIRYIEQAKDIIQHGIPQNLYYDAPGWPYMVSVFFFIFGEENFYPIFVFNSLLSSATTILIYYIGKIAFNKQIALWSAAWSITYYFFFQSTGSILKENIQIFMLTLLVFMFIKYMIDNKLKTLILLTLFLAITFHTDERYMVYTAFIGLFLLINDVKTGKKLKHTMVYVVLVIITLIPWTIRNYGQYDRVVIITERTTRFTDKIFGYETPTESLPGITSYNRDYLPLYEAITDSIERGLEVTSNVRYITNIKMAVNNGDKLVTLTIPQHYWEEFKEYWQPFRFSKTAVAYGYRYFKGGWSFGHNVIVMGTYGVLIPFFLIGVFFYFKRKDKFGYVLFAVIMIHFLLHIVAFHTQQRYRLPTDPMYILTAFYGVYYLFNKKQRDPKQESETITT